MKLGLALAEFRKAVEELEVALGEAPTTRLEQAGSILIFDLCFELAWKSLRLAAEREGLRDAVSPRACIEAATAIGWIEDEALWLDMLESRAALATVSDLDAALDVFFRLGAYLPALEDLGRRLGA